MGEGIKYFKFYSSQSHTRPGSENMFLAKFRFSAFFLVYSVIIYTEVHSEVFFFDDEMIIHSKKNIENFYVNLQALSELVQHIKGTVR